MKTPKVPEGARRIRTFAELESYLADFASLKEPFLWVVGRPGLSKSESIKKATGGRKVLLVAGGHLTPFSFFCLCYKWRGCAIILDDAEHFLDNPLGTKLVAALSETVPAKRMNWL